MVSFPVIVEPADDAGNAHIDGYQRNVGLWQDANGMPRTPILTFPLAISARWGILKHDDNIVSIFLPGTNRYIGCSAQTGDRWCLSASAPTPSHSKTFLRGSALQSAHLGKVCFLILLMNTVCNTLITYISRYSLNSMPQLMPSWFPFLRCWHLHSQIFGPPALVNLKIFENLLFSITAFATSASLVSIGWWTSKRDLLHSSSWYFLM